MTDTKQRTSREWNRLLQRTVGGEWSHDHSNASHGIYRTANYNAPNEGDEGKADRILQALLEKGIAAYIERNAEKRTEHVCIAGSELAAKGAVLDDTQVRAA